MSITKKEVRLLVNNFCIDNNLMTNDFYSARPINTSKLFSENMIKIVDENPSDTVFVVGKESYFGNVFPDKNKVEANGVVLFIP